LPDKRCGDVMQDTNNSNSETSGRKEIFIIVDRKYRSVILLLTSVIEKRNHDCIFLPNSRSIAHLM
jgi:hypothetical protein